MARHEPLRTVFSAADGKVWQHVQPAGPVPLEPVATAPEDLDAVLAEAAARPFDLAEGPLLRVRLHRLGPREHVLFLGMHHIVSDGWSLRVLIDELTRLYAAFAAGTEPALPALPIQYADYALWQRHWNEAGEGERELDFWRGILGSEHPVLELPADRPRPAARNGAGGAVTHRFSADDAGRLRELAAENGATLFMLLLAAFMAWLHRVTGQEDLRVGVPVANRSRAECERLIGFFVNTQVLRLGVAGGMRFDALLAAVRRLALLAQAHQDLPFEQLVEALQPERSLGHNPLFQVMLNHEQHELSGFTRLGDLKVEPFALPVPAAKVDLSLDTAEHPDGTLLRHLHLRRRHPRPGHGGASAGELRASSDPDRPGACSPDPGV